MERLTDVNDVRVQFWRAWDIQGAAAGEDADLLHDGSTDGLPGEIDMRSRADVAWYQDASGTWHPSALKRDDDVFAAGIPMRIIGPARSRDWFAAYYDPWLGDTPIYLPLSCITDRAPADPEETPMPIIPEAPP